jgi:hypothetical protein
MPVRQVTDLINRLADHGDQPSGKKGKFTGKPYSYSLRSANGCDARETREEPLDGFSLYLTNTVNLVYNSLCNKVVCSFIWNSRPIWRAMSQIASLDILKNYYFVSEGVPPMSQRISVNGRTLTGGYCMMHNDDVVRMSVLIRGGMESVRKVPAVGQQGIFHLGWTSPHW